MNIPTKEELINYRVVVGNNTPTTHPILGTIPVKGCFPLPVTQTGTISTDNAGTTAGLEVSGSGTFFHRGNATGSGVGKVEPGDFLADANGILRRVRFVESDTRLTLEAKFPTSLAGAILKVVKKNFYRYMLASSTGSATAILNEQNFASNDKWFDDGAPVSYDVTTASSEISFTLSV